MRTPSVVSEYTMMGYRLLFCSFLATLCVAGSACTLAVASDRVQCHTDLDCVARGPAYADFVCSNSVCQPDPTWSCLDNPTQDVAPTSTVEVKMTASDLLSAKPVAGIHLTLCAKLDADCVYPISDYQSDQNGLIDIQMPATFDGYLQTEGDNVYPTLFFPPKTEKQSAPTSLPIVPAAFFAGMFNQIGTSVSSDRTVIMTTALDCQGQPASGMVLSSPQADGATVTYFLQGGLPSRSAPTTDASGAGGFVNIPTGSAVVTSTIAAKDRVAGTVAVQTRPGHLTMVLVVPNGS